MSKPINLVIWVSGGNVVGVSTDLANPDRVNVMVCDQDNAEGNTFDPLMIVPEFGKCVVGGEIVASEPLQVQAVLNFYKHHNGA